MIGTLLFYLVVLAILLLCCRNESNVNENSKNIKVAYIILFIISIIRFDIGNDYNRYADSAIYFANVFSQGHNFFDVIVQSWEDKEVTFVLLSYIFSFSSNPFVWMNAVYSAILCYGLYRILNHYKIHFWGLFVFIVCEFLFASWDWIRQSAAAIIILNTYPLLESGKFSFKSLFIYILAVICAWAFHTSAMYMAILYPLSFVKIPNKAIILSFIVVVVLFWTGILDDFIYTFSYYMQFATDKYVGYEDNYATVNVATSVLYKLRTTLHFIFALCVVITLPKEKNILRLFLLVGYSIYMLSNGSLIFSRIAWYFMFFIMIGFPLCIKELKNTSTKPLKTGVGIIVILMCFLFVRDIAVESNVRGCVPYETIFSTEFQNNKYRND